MYKELNKGTNKRNIRLEGKKIEEKKRKNYVKRQFPLTKRQTKRSKYMEWLAKYNKKLDEIKRIIKLKKKYQAKIKELEYKCRKLWYDYKRPYSSIYKTKVSSRILIIRYQTIIEQLKNKYRKIVLKEQEYIQFINPWIDSDNIWRKNWIDDEDKKNKWESIIRFYKMNGKCDDIIMKKKRLRGLPFKWVLQRQFSILSNRIMRSYVYSLIGVGDIDRSKKKKSKEDWNDIYRDKFNRYDWHGNIQVKLQKMVLMPQEVYKRVLHPIYELVEQETKFKDLLNGLNGLELQWKLVKNFRGVKGMTIRRILYNSYKVYDRIFKNIVIDNIWERYSKRFMKNEYARKARLKLGGNFEDYTKVFFSDETKKKVFFRIRERIRYVSKKRFKSIVRKKRMRRLKLKYYIRKSVKRKILLEDH